MFEGKFLRLTGCLIFAAFGLYCCNTKPEKRKGNRRAEYIREIAGKNDSIPPEAIQKGKVLIGYSDCYTCHKEDRKSFGPAFIDIAKRYPANKVYIDMLAQKVIVGGSRSWGYPVMDPHPKLKLEDARMMVAYILSLEEHYEYDNRKDQKP